MEPHKTNRFQVNFRCFFSNCTPPPHCLFCFGQCLVSERLWFRHLRGRWSFSCFFFSRSLAFSSASCSVLMSVDFFFFFSPGKHANHRTWTCQFSGVFCFHFFLKHFQGCHDSHRMESNLMFLVRNSIMLLGEKCRFHKTFMMLGATGLLLLITGKKLSRCLNLLEEIFSRCLQNLSTVQTLSVQV